MFHNQLFSCTNPTMQGKASTKISKTMRHCRKAIWVAQMGGATIKNMHQYCMPDFNPTTSILSCIYMDLVIKHAIIFLSAPTWNWAQLQLFQTRPAVGAGHPQTNCLSFRLLFSSSPFVSSDKSVPKSKQGVKYIRSTIQRDWHRHVCQTFKRSVLNCWRNCSNTSDAFQPWSQRSLSL